MAFNKDNFVPVSAMANSSASRMFSYTSASDNLAAIKASGYFNAAAAPTGGLGLTDGDIVIATGSDAVSFLAIDVTGSTATVGSANDFA